MELTPLHYAAIFLVGLVVGSFFNVCIHRWPKEDPKERDIVFKPSHCPKCGAKIRWYDNIPVFSWLILLRGKCRDCKAPISWRYPAVELANGLLWVLTAWLVATQGFSGVDPAKQTWWHIVFAIYFASLYLLTIVIDAETQLIPDEICIGHVIGSVLFLWACHGATVSSGWLSSLIAGLALAAFFFIFERLDWMGMGDVLLAFGLGALFGWPAVIAMAFISVLVGGFLGIFVIIYKMAKKTYKLGTVIPYGPFLALGAYVSMFFGHELIAWYLNTFLYHRPAGIGG